MTASAPLHRFDPDELTAREAAARDTMEFVLRLRARGVADLDVLRALETVPRLAFSPHRYADLALRDIALPIPCGQTMSEPFELAKILEALKLTRRHRVLEIGTGSGYGSALLAKLADKVVTIDRFKTLSLEARLRLETLNVNNVLPVWGDGLDLPRELGTYDRILIDGAVEAARLPDYLRFLDDGGVLTASVRRGPDGPVERVQIAQAYGAFVETVYGPSRAAPLIAGCSRGL